MREREREGERVSVYVREKKKARERECAHVYTHKIYKYINVVKQQNSIHIKKLPNRRTPPIKRNCASQKGINKFFGKPEMYTCKHTNTHT